MIFNSPQLSDGTSVCNIYNCTLFHLQFRDNDMHSISSRLLFSIIVHIFSLILMPIYMESGYFWFSMLMLSFQSFWLCMWEKFLYLICEGLVPAPHMAAPKAGVGMYAIVTTIILVCEFLAPSSLLFPSTFVTVHFH